MSSPEFDASERNRRFLSYVVTETLEGRGDRIKGYNIATEVFGRPPSFDPQSDPIVRIEARRLRRSLERYYLIAQRDALLRICIPKGSYVPCFELDSGVEPAEPSASMPVMPSGTQPRPSIIVTAFEAEGDQSSFPHFTSGLTRQIVIGLTRFTDLVVFGPDMACEPGPSSERDGIREEPGADLLLTGGTTLSNDRFGVEALLVDLRTGQTVWAASYDRCLDPGNIVTLRDEVAGTIARTIAQPYGLIFQRRTKEIEGAPPESLRSYACVIQFYQSYWRTMAQNGRETVRDCLEETIRREPFYADAHACLSLLYSNDFRFGVSDTPEARAALERADGLARRAVELAPASSHAHHALAVVRWFSGDVEASLAAYTAGLELNPNNTQIMADFGLRQALRMNWDRAVPLLKRSYELNPAQPETFRVGLALWHYMHGRFAEALAEARRVDAPDVIYGHLLVAVSALELGRLDEAESALARIQSIRPDYADRAASDLTVRNVHPEIIRMVTGSLDKGGPERRAAARSF